MTKTINALTLVLTVADMHKQLAENRPTLTSLRLTCRDVAEVDRVVYVDLLGTETYLKDRYPADQLPGIDIVEHRVVRPKHLTVDDLEAWVQTLWEHRLHLLAKGTLAD